MINLLKKILPLKLIRSILPAYHFIMAWLAACYYAFPSRRLIVIGVTGTTGKTSTVSLLASILNDNGYPAGYTSTAQFNDGRREWLNDKKMTMPGRFFLQKNLKRMLKNGCKVAIVETTSQGIEQFRHRFIDYDILLFTNLYPEHIEAHGGYENYKQAKGKLFAHLKRCRFKYLNDDNRVVVNPTALQKTEFKKLKKRIIVNADDKQSVYFSSFWSEAKTAYSQAANLELNKNILSEIEPKVDVVAYEELFSGIDGSDFIFANERYHLSILGSYNIVNAVAALSIARELDIDAKALAEALAKITVLPGKMEKIEAGQDFHVLVDYAFEPKALTALYENLEIFNYNRLIHVLGSTGGGRDQSRRPILGLLAGEKADFVIITNEDPYDEDPLLIIDQISVGAEKSAKKLGVNLWKEPDRRQAIIRALNLAQTGDLVLVTGKGAEQYICGPNNTKIDWDDRRVLKEELDKL